MQVQVKNESTENSKTMGLSKYHALSSTLDGFQKNCSLEVLLTILAEYEISFIQI